MRTDACPTPSQPAPGTGGLSPNPAGCSPISKILRIDLDVLRGNQFRRPGVPQDRPLTWQFIN
jgi:hypothetical protein